MSVYRYTPNMTTCSVRNEIPSGALDYSNKTFTLINSPAAGSLALYVNGIRFVEDVDFTLAAKVISTTDAPGVSDTIIADYEF